MFIKNLIVGSGFSGLGAAITLWQLGDEPFLVIEKENDLGGTWRDNTYPGCACDVESNLYSYSFFPRPEWTLVFSGQKEILGYLKAAADHFGITRTIRFSHELTEAHWNESAKRWDVSIRHASGVVERWQCQNLILGMGPLHLPHVPKFPQSGEFCGTTFHSARWNHAFDLSGKNVAVIGAGASAIQFIPEIQESAKKLYLFQRTAPWVLPQYNRMTSPLERKLFRAFPALQKVRRSMIAIFRENFYWIFKYPRLGRVLERLASWNIQRAIKDPETLQKVLPTYRMGCKRILVSNAYYPALSQDNVSIVSEKISRFRPDAIETADGATYPVDAVIYATGFHVTDQPFARQITGRGGVSLHEAWGGSPFSHLGTTVAGFPNLFFLLGPQTGLGHTSILLMLEAQLGLVADLITSTTRAGAETVMPRREAQEKFLGEVAQGIKNTVWVAGGCTSWYIDKNGNPSTLWPFTATRFRKRLRRWRREEFEFE